MSVLEITWRYCCFHHASARVHHAAVTVCRILNITTFKRYLKHKFIQNFVKIGPLFKESEGGPTTRLMKGNMLESRKIVWKTESFPS